MNKTTLILLATALASGAALAQTASGGSQREARHEQHRQRAEAAFAESDSNHDGRLSQSEWQAARLRESNERFRKLDLDRNGSLSREEMQQARAQRKGARHGGMKERLRGLDTDGDQQLSRAEIGDRMPKLAQEFDRIDGNADGKLSREEMRAARQARHSSKGRGDDAQR